MAPKSASLLLDFAFLAEFFIFEKASSIRLKSAE
jgi:hypothetical protein